jgi:CBS domain containing-hemolysin-like protein
VGQTVLRLVLMLVLLGFSAFFAAAETAIFSLRLQQIARLRTRGSRAARAVTALLEHPRRVLATVLVGNTTVNLLLSVIATGLFVEWLGEQRGLLAASFGLTILVLVFGEIVPKTLAVGRPMALALRLARPLAAADRVLQPATRTLARLTTAATHLVARRVRPREPALSEEEIKMLVTMGWEQGLVGAREKDFIHNVFELDDRWIGEIATPRQRVFAVPLDATVAEVQRAVRRAGFARVPTWSGSPENLVGYVEAIDLLWEHDGPDPRRVAELRRDLPFYPETKRVGELLVEMRHGAPEMAAVIDEHGDFAGIVTLEDAIEQVVGEIFDVHDLDRLRFTSLPGGEVLVLAQMEIPVFNELMGVRLRDPEAETIGGFVVNRLGRIPAVRETLDVHGLRFTVEQAAPNRVIQLRVRRHELRERAK